MVASLILSNRDPSASGDAVYVWDGFIRSYHWLQVLIIGGCWWSAEEGYLAWHMLLASGLLALWLTRIIWGFIGPHPARFAEFCRGPRATLQYARAMLIGKAKPGYGHDPLGAWMILALLAVIGAQLATGLFSSDGFFASGPLATYLDSGLSDLITQLHHAIFDGIWILAAIHVSAVLLFEIRGERLIGPMLVGYKPQRPNAIALDADASTAQSQPAAQTQLPIQTKPMSAWVAFMIAGLIWIALVSGFWSAGSLVGLTG